jgi:ferredoxin
MMKTRFGFEIQDTRQIDLDREDTSLADEVAALVPSMKACIRCGTCVATCPEGEGVLKLTAFEKLSALSSCQLCGKCVLTCPRGINTRHLIIRYMEKYKEYGKAV